MYLLFDASLLLISTLLTINIRLTVGQNTAEGRIVISNSEESSLEKRECKPVSECKSFLYLLQKHRTPDVLQDLVARDCGFTGTSQLIWCPIDDKIKTLTLDPDDERRGGGVLTSLLRNKESCNGSLIIMHYGETK